MKEAEFQLLDPLADDLDERCDQWFDSPPMVEFKEALRRASAALPSGYMLELAIELRVCDTSREGALRILTAGLGCQRGEPPFRTSGDSTSQRYIVDGELCELPHDYCPRCWGGWDFKLIHPQCPECGCRLGPDLKLLLDRDTCPNCEKGSVSIKQSICPACSFKVNPDLVTWG